MADREPRRRKKRRDSQKKEDIRSDDQTFTSTKPESRDSDEAEEEIVIPSHSHPASNVSKVVFVILFSGLVVSLSFIFISLQGADKGPVDIFDASHDDHHGEALHDEHLDEALHDDHDDHEEDQVNLEDLIPGIGSLGSIFSLNNEKIKDSESLVTQSIPEDVQEEIEIEKPRSVTTVEPESATDQGILEKYIEESVEHYTPDPILEEPPSSDFYTEATPITSFTEDESSYSTFDYSEAGDFTAPSTQPDDKKPTPEPFINELKDDMPATLDKGVEDNVEDSSDDSFLYYERSDITNEADFEIRDQLDEVDSVLEKESNNNDEEDDDDDEEDDGAEDEFDFWQF